MSDNYTPNDGLHDEMIMADLIAACDEALNWADANARAFPIETAPANKWVEVWCSVNKVWLPVFVFPEWTPGSTVTPAMFEAAIEAWFKVVEGIDPRTCDGVPVPPENLHDALKAALEAAVGERK